MGVKLPGDPGFAYDWDGIDPDLDGPSSPEWEDERRRIARSVRRSPISAAVWLADFVEDLHPRDETGKFTSGGGGEKKAEVSGIERVAKVHEERAAWRASPERAMAVGTLGGTLAQMSRSYDDMDATLWEQPMRSPAVWGENENALPEAYADAEAREIEGWVDPVEHDDAVERLWSEAGDAAAWWQEGSGVQQLRADYEEWIANRDDMPIDEYQRLTNSDSLFELLENAEPYDGDLYRGMYVDSRDADELLNLKAGDTLDQQLAGWSSSPEIANVFGFDGAVDNGWTPTRDTEGWDTDVDELLNSELTNAQNPGSSGYIVSLKLDEGAPALPVGLLSSASNEPAAVSGERYAWQREWMVGAPLTVTRVEILEPLETADGGAMQPGQIYVEVKA